MHPCSGCVQHGTVALCVYAVKPWIARNVTDTDSSSSSLLSQLPPATSVYCTEIPGTQTFSMNRHPGKSASLPLEQPTPGSLRTVESELSPAMHSQAKFFPQTSYSSAGPSVVAVSDHYRQDTERNTQDEMSAVKQLPGGVTHMQEYNELKLRMERLERMIQRSGANEDHSKTESSKAPVKHAPIFDDAVSGAKESATSTTSLSVRIPANGEVISAVLSSTDEKRLRPDVKIKRNRFTYRGPLSSLSALLQDSYLVQFVSKDEFIQAKRAQKKTVKEKKAAALKTIGHLPMSPESEAFLKENFDVNADPVTVFPRLEHRGLCEYLITRFMQSINLVVPIVHPTSFRADIMKHWAYKWKCQAAGESFFESKKLGHDDCGSKHKEYMRGNALIAIILRLGRMACGSDWTPSSAGFNDKYASLFGYQLRDFAWKCLSETSYLQKSDFVSLQVLLAIRIHNMLAVEVGEGLDSADSVSFSGLLCQVALSMGLHRDPDNFPHVPPDLADAWRVMWGEVLSVDTDRSLCIDVPFALSLEMSDTSIDKLRVFSSVTSDNEQPSLHFLKCKINFCILARSILSRLQIPNFVLEKEEFEHHMAALTEYEEQNLSSFQLLVEMINAETHSAVSSHQDSYDLTQKYILQLQFSHLQLTLLRAYSPATKADGERIYVARLRCAEKQLDTIVTCNRRPQLFSGFMPLITPISLRHSRVSLYCVITGIFRQIVDAPVVVAARKDALLKEQWRTPDMAFQYQTEDVCDIKRLFQTVNKIYEWVESESERAISAFRITQVMKIYIKACNNAFKNIAGSVADADLILTDNMLASAVSDQAEGVASESASQTTETDTGVTSVDGKEWTAILNYLELDSADTMMATMYDDQATIGEWWHDWSISVEDALTDQMQ